MVISRLVLIFALPLDLHGSVRVVTSMYIPAALHGVEKPLCWLLTAHASFGLLSIGLSGLAVSRQLVLAQSSVSWMVLLDVTLLIAWSGSGFACFEGILLFGPLRLVVLIVCWRWLVPVLRQCL